MIYNDDFYHDQIVEEWLIDGVLPSVGITVLSGNDGQKNALMALELALSVANGKDWQGKKTPVKKQVIYITIDGKRKVAKRIKIWNEAHNHCKSTLLTSLHDAVDLLDLSQLQQLVSDIADCNSSYDEWPALVVIDIQGGLTCEPTKMEYALDLLRSLDYLNEQMEVAFLLVYNEGSDDFCFGFSTLLHYSEYFYKVTSTEDTPARLTYTDMKFDHKSNSVVFDLSCVEKSTFMGCK